MKDIHIPTLIISVVCIFCTSTVRFDMAKTIQYTWTGLCIFLILSTFLLKWVQSVPIHLPKEKILKTFCFVAILEVLYVIVQLTGSVPDNYRYAYFSGTLNNPAILGMLLSFCTPVSLYFAIKSSDTEALCWKFIFILFAVFVILSDSRTAIISSLCGIVVLGFAEKWIVPIRVNRCIKISLPLLLIGGLTLLYFYKRDSADGRMLIWNVSWNMIKEKPLWGWGTNGFVAQYMNFQADYFTEHPDSSFAMLAGETQNPFNEIVNIAVHFGIPAAFVFISILIWSVQFICKHVGEYRGILLALISIFFVWCLFSYPFEVPFVWLILFFIAMSMFKSEYMSRATRIYCIVTFAIISLCFYSFASICFREFHRVNLQDRTNIAINNDIMSEYALMYKDYSTNGLFLYNYGAVLHLMNEYENSLNVFKECSLYLSDYNMMLLMGDDYQKMNMPDSALNCYQRASRMIPNRFLPLYYQMKLYQEQKEYDKARGIALFILQKEIKIKESHVIKKIQKAAKDYLEEYKETFYISEDKSDNMSLGL